MKANRSFGGKYGFHLQGRISLARNQRESRDLYFSAYYSALNMKAICYSETSVGFQQTAQRYITGDRNLPLNVSLE
jgi:hypothetical protein